MKCSNAKCHWVGTLSTLKDHETKCEFALVMCKFRRLGCKEKLMRSDMTAHEEDDKLHLHMAIETIAQLTEERAKTLLKNEEYTFRVENYKAMMKKKGTFYTQSFYTSSEGYHIAVAVKFNDSGTHITPVFGVLKGDNDKKLSWPFIGQVTFTLLNQLENDNHYYATTSITTEDQIMANSCWSLSDFFPSSGLDHDPVKKTQYLKDDTLYFSVSVEVAGLKPWLQCNLDFEAETL